MVSAYSVTGYLLTHMAKVLRIVGADPSPLFIESNLEEAALQDPEARVPLDVAMSFWERAASLGADPLFGLTIADHAKEGFPILRYALANSQTIEECFGRWSRFYRLMTDAWTQSLEGPDEAIMCCRWRSKVPIVVEDWMVGQWLSLGRLLSGTEWTPRRVVLTHTGSAHHERYERWFGARVDFGGAESSIHLEERVLQLPIVGADPALASLLDRHINDVLARLPKASSFAERVRESMARQLDGGDPSARAIAQALGMSERTLLRRLKDEGTSPRQELETLRRQLAQRYLCDPSLTITEVAFLLGYAEAAPFHRAFKRWMGKTPMEFRRAQSPKESSTTGPF